MVVPLGRSTKSLDKSVVPTPPERLEFLKTWAEFHADKDKQVMQFFSASGGGSARFTVPDNQTLFITGIHMDLSTETGALGGAGSGVMDLTGTGRRLAILSHREINQQPLVSTTSNDFTMPIRAEAGQEITLSVSGPVGQVLAHANIFGFLIDKQIISVR